MFYDIIEYELELRHNPFQKKYGKLCRNIALYENLVLIVIRLC